MEQNPSWEANDSLASQKMFRILLEPNVHYLVHYSPPLVPILSQMSQTTLSHPVSLTSILILSSCLRLDCPSRLVPSRSRAKILYAVPFCPT